MKYLVKSLMDGHTLLCVEFPAGSNGTQLAKEAANVAIRADDDASGLYGDDGTYYGPLDINPHQRTSHYRASRRNSPAYMDTVEMLSVGAQR